MKAKVMSLRVPEELLSSINEAASEDMRPQSDEIRYLIGLGLSDRNRRRDQESMQDGPKVPA